MDRAIPYLEDGLKPGQRRILYTLWRNQSKGLLKVSSATGLVLTLHPHGPASVESAIVNMAQDYTFSNNYPIIDKKGYFGERMETQPAAGRYIECKLGKVAEILLFDDMNQVPMVPNYDEKVMEPVGLLPKLPLMLLNGAEGIGTGFSSVIPSFHHSDIIESMIQVIENGQPKKIKPFFMHYSQKVDIDKSQKIIFPMKFEMVNESIYITDLPRGYDAVKIYRLLGKYIDDGYLKDYIDSTVDNDVRIELVFKRGQQPPLEEVQKKIGVSTSMVPNYTLISERGVRIFDRPEEIVEIFAKRRLAVVKRRYELLCEEFGEKLRQHNEIIKFIKDKEYEIATKKANRKEFVTYLSDKKYHFSEYLADMPIYKMTKEEVAKRKLMVEEDSAKLADYTKVAKSDALVAKKLIEELRSVDEQLNSWLKARESERIKLRKELEKRSGRQKRGQ
jgi:DNA gyrase subunit A